MSQQQQQQQRTVSHGGAEEEAEPATWMLLPFPAPGIQASPQRVLLTQGGAPGQNGRQLTLLILRILSGKRSPPSPKHFIIRELETVLPTAIP